MRMSLDEAWPELTALLAGHDDGDHLHGAELVVRDGAVEVLRAALARHARRDDATAVVWVRPLGPPDTDRESGLPAFDPLVCRRRALDVVAVERRGQQLELTLSTGQHAIVRPARGTQLQVLQDFDTWLTTQPTELADDLERLSHD